MARDDCPNERDLTTRLRSPPCYDEHVAVCEVLHSLHGRVVTLEQRVVMLEGLCEKLLMPGDALGKDE